MLRTYVHGLKQSSLSAIRLLVTLVLIAAPINVSFAGSPWARATGEARELQRTTKDLRNRLSRLFPYSPATRYSIALDESANHLIEATRHETPSYLLESQLNGFASLYDQLRVMIASDFQLASDRNVARYSADIAKRFDYLVRDLQRAKPPVIAHPSIVPQFPNGESRHSLRRPSTALPCEERPFAQPLPPTLPPQIPYQSQYRSPVEFALPGISM